MSRFSVDIQFRHFTSTSRRSLDIPKEGVLPVPHAPTSSARTLLRDQPLTAVDSVTRGSNKDRAIWRMDETGPVDLARN